MSAFARISGDAGRGETLLPHGDEAIDMLHSPTLSAGQNARKASTAFLVAGLLLIASPTHVGLEVYMGIALPIWGVGVFVVPGLLAAVIGGLLLSRDLSRNAPYWGHSTTVVGTISSLLLLTLLVWILGRPVVEKTSAQALGQPPDVLFALLPPFLGLTFGLLGLGVLVTDSTSDRIGVILLVMALPWLGVLAATTIVTGTFPAWLTLALYGPLPVISVVTGYALRVDISTIDQTEAHLDVPTE